MASEYATLALLQPLMVELRATAPNITLRLRPIMPTFIEELQRHHVDVVIVPVESLVPGGQVPTQVLYRDPYVVAVDKAHPVITDSLGLDQFSSLPYLAVKAGSAPVLVEVQLDELGIQRRTAVTTDFAWAPFLVRGTSLMTVLPQSFAARLAPGLGLKLLQPPMTLRPITEAMLWKPQHDDEPAHRWLREQLASFAARLQAEGVGTDGAAR
jgi:DNA-binding transcriptional LysR family regulator